jgi:hypothetical protein
VTNNRIEKEHETKPESLNSTPGHRPGGEAAPNGLHRPAIGEPTTEGSAVADHEIFDKIQVRNSGPYKTRFIV